MALFIDTEAAAILVGSCCVTFCCESVEEVIMITSSPLRGGKEDGAEGGILLFVDTEAAAILVDGNDVDTFCCE